MIQERIRWIDVYKGIAIVLVVVGHCPISEPCYKFIYSFHLLAFFFISGYTFKLHKDEPFGKFVNKKAKRLLIPYFFFGTMWMFTSWTIQYVHHTFDSSINSILNDIYCLLTASGYHDISGPAWFLFALFTASLLFYAVCYVYECYPKFAMGGVIVSFAIGYYLSGKAYAPFQITQALTVIPVMLMGYSLKRIGLPELNRLQSLFLCLIGFVMVWFLSQYDRPVNLVSNTLMGNPLLFIACGALGIVSLILLSKNIFGLASRIFMFFGVESMTLMGIHQEIRSMSNLLANSFFELSRMQLLVVNLLSVFILSVPIIWLLNTYFPKLTGKR